VWRWQWLASSFHHGYDYTKTGSGVPPAGSRFSGGSCHGVLYPIALEVARDFGEGMARLECVRNKAFRKAFDA
jgi:hypothetical protein